VRSILYTTLATLGVITALGVTTASAAGCASPPSVSNITVSGVAPSAATLHADVNPNGCNAQYSFQYGTTPSYGTATAPASAGSGTDPKSVAVRITGLASNTIYHFTIAATNAAGTTNGPDRTFRTSLNCASGGPLPSIANTDVIRVTQLRAWLHATVDPNGCTTSYQFEYGKTTAYGHRTPIVHVGSGTSPISAQEAIGGLLPNTKYHFRLVAYSGTGKAFGSDRTFTTKLAAAVSIAPGPGYLDKPFVSAIRLRCVHGNSGCSGHVKLFWSHHVIGQHRFFLRRGQTALVLIGLDGLGRALFRAHQMLRVGVVARLRYYTATRLVRLIRRFAVP
jgi:hypothetical protein